MKKFYFLLAFIFSLSGCGEKEIPHQHTYSSSWSFDASYHWHASTCGHDVVSEKADHYFKDIITPATYDSCGYTTHICFCGYSYVDSETNKLIHHYSNQWSYDNNGHWHYCIDQGYEELKDEVNTHEFVSTIVPPTYDSCGYTIHTCECGYTFSDSETNKLSHNYSNKWTIDETYHWHACIDAGYEGLFIDKTAHQFDEIIIDGVEDKEGYTLHMCECGYYFKDTYTSAPDKFTYQLNSDKTGYMICGYTGDAKNIIIPSTYNSLPVLEIASYAFREADITSVVVSNSVTRISMAAFQLCTSLISFVLSGSVNYIGAFAFSHCYLLPSIIIPINVTKILDDAFRYCNSLSIYCEVSSKPSDWVNSWNPDNRPVIWGYGN